MTHLWFTRKPSKYSKSVPSWELKDLRDEPSYHWALDREEAETKIQNHHGKRCYLTRYCEESRMFLLSVMERRKNSDPVFEHFQFIIKRKRRKKTRYTLEGSDVKFPKVSEMLEYYHSNPVSHHFSNIGVPVLYQVESVEECESEHSTEEKPEVSLWSALPECI